MSAVSSATSPTPPLATLNAKSTIDWLSFLVLMSTAVSAASLLMSLRAMLTPAKSMGPIPSFPPILFPAYIAPAVIPAFTAPCMVASALPCPWPIDSTYCWLKDSEAAKAMTAPSAAFGFRVTTPAVRPTVAYLTSSVPACRYVRSA